jgi:ureidoacrylate peracid hydrolase
MGALGAGVNLDTPFGPISFEVATTAVMVVDMQNDFASPHGMFARAGIDITPIRAVVEPTARVLAAARRAGMPVVYLKMGFRPDLSDTGGADAPNWFKVHAPIGVGEAITLPDGTSGRILVRDTWNTDILADLVPAPGDAVVYKTRFSGFYDTDLDDVLRGLGVRTLVFTGCTTSVCVESTLRDAFFRDYHCVLLEDCVAEPVGHGMPRSNHEATVLLVNIMFGWVCQSDGLIGALDRAPVASRP